MSTSEHTEIPAGAEGRPSHSHQYPRLDKWFNDTPWAITKPMLTVISEIRQVRLSGFRFSAEEIEQRVEAGRAGSRPDRRAGAIAVIPLYGVIIPKANLMTSMSGGMTLQDFRGMLRAAVDDPDVTSILIDVDSPGGSVDQVPETAADVRAAAKAKPVYAIANTDAYSAAYWIGSQAGELWVTPSGGVGSVGVYALHEDWSGFNAKAGIDPTYISFGERKTDGNPDEPLSDDAKAKIQADVNAFGEMFVADVAKGRGTTTKAVRADFGQGSTVMAKDAVAAGMADKVGTIEQLISEISRQPSKGRARAAVEQPEPASLAEAPDESTEFPVAGVAGPEEREPAEPEPALVEGAERLLRHSAVRDQFAPATA